MTVSFHKYGEYFPGTGDLRVRPNSVRINIRWAVGGCQFLEDHVILFILFVYLWWDLGIWCVLGCVVGCLWQCGLALAEQLLGSLFTVRICKVWTSWTLLVVQFWLLCLYRNEGSDTVSAQLNISADPKTFGALSRLHRLSLGGRGWGPNGCGQNSIGVGYRISHCPVVMCWERSGRAFIWDQSHRVPQGPSLSW